MGKKIREAMEKEREKFTTGVVEQGYDQSLAVEMFDIIAQFADYAFNKSHSYGYGYVAYQIAYLKANHPVEYLSALLTSVKSKLESAAVYLNECRLMGIDVEVPDINRSEMDFTPVPNPDWDGGPYAEGSDQRGATPGSIIFGMSAIRNVGEGIVEKILAARNEGGPFESFIDFVERVEIEALNKRTIESLIKGGAFDCLGHPRKGLLQVYEQIIDLTVQRRKEHDMGVMSLFGNSTMALPSTNDHRFLMSNSTRCLASRTKRRCSASTSPTIHCSVLRRRFGARPTPGWPDSPIPPTERSSRSAGSSRISSASGPARAI